MLSPGDIRMRVTESCGVAIVQTLALVWLKTGLRSRSGDPCAFTKFESAKISLESMEVKALALVWPLSSTLLRCKFFTL